MKKKRSLWILSGLIFSATAIACVTLPLPIPPLPVKLSWTDLAKAKAEGFSNPGHAAAMKKIDSYASTVVGDATWQKNNYQGYFNYSSPLGGANMIFIDKPCGKKAIDQSEKGLADTGGGGGPFDDIGLPGAPGGGHCSIGSEPRQACTSVGDPQGASTGNQVCHWVNVDVLVC